MNRIRMVRAEFFLGSFCAVGYYRSTMVMRTTDLSHQQRRACYFSGRVQGVGFRYTVQNIAIKYNVYGYVRNLPDGRVELVMEGETDEMDHLVDAVSNKMNGYIQKIDNDTLPATGEFDHFYIRH